MTTSSKQAPISGSNASPLVHRHGPCPGLARRPRHATRSPTNLGRNRARPAATRECPGRSVPSIAGPERPTGAVHRSMASSHTGGRRGTPDALAHGPPGSRTHAVRRPCYGIDAPAASEDMKVRIAGGLADGHRPAQCAGTVRQRAPNRFDLLGSAPRRGRSDSVSRSHWSPAKSGCKRIGAPPLANIARLPVSR